ncbi:hypothetical protein KFE25_004464 [Diacronema lutheri]|uniref:Uncharacterized protein n=2 Tax=Diacronema lutheri TaxID=2081491 RepID=A0A8J5X7L8_DIALT|nr:hypothetical protein KFE25_004464 [Diacronema lutheri]
MLALFTRRALSSRAAAAGKVAQPPVVAKGDTRYVLERRGWLAEVSRLRKEYAREQAEARAAQAASRDVAMQRVAQRREEARGMKRSRAAEVQQRLDQARRAAELALERSHRESAERALAAAGDHRARIAARVRALAAESRVWIAPEAVDDEIGPQLFSSVRSPVNDTPAFRRTPAPDEARARRSGFAPDAELLAELAKEGSVDLPIWLRHTLVGPSRSGAAP